MTSTGQAAAAPRAAPVRTLLLTFVLTLLLAVTCGSGNPSAAGPRAAAPPPRVLAALPTPYETAPSNDGELAAAPSRAAARHQGQRRTTPRRSTPCHAGLAELPPVPALLEPRTASDSGTRARRHHPYGPDAARPHALEPSATQVFRC
ncbi:hypothetical protein [Streptomyces sp. NPDC051921]|uniref:hypothetical protein n=1 Tax=Streptomyces sp. NPDC051921 TaxID=3155806 RepID=UPI00341B0837